MRQIARSRRIFMQAVLFNYDSISSWFGEVNVAPDNRCDRVGQRDRHDLTDASNAFHFASYNRCSPRTLGDQSVDRPQSRWLV
jgi:hypothetical protein